MSSRLKEVEAMAELKDLRLKVMDLETQTHVYHNQLKRQGEDAAKLSDELEDRKKQEVELQTQLRSVQCLLCIQRESAMERNNKIKDPHRVIFFFHPQHLISSIYSIRPVKLSVMNLLLSYKKNNIQIHHLLLSSSFTFLIIEFYIDNIQNFIPVMKLSPFDCDSIIMSESPRGSSRSWRGS